jgi:hypothetical protein
MPYLSLHVFSFFSTADTSLFNSSFVLQKYAEALTVPSFFVKLFIGAWCSSAQVDLTTMSAYLSNASAMSFGFILLTLDDGMATLRFGSAAYTSTLESLSTHHTSVLRISFHTLRCFPFPFHLTSRQMLPFRAREPTKALSSNGFVKHSVRRRLIVGRAGFEPATIRFLHI